MKMALHLHTWMGEPRLMVTRSPIMVIAATRRFKVGAT